MNHLCLPSEILGLIIQHVNKRDLLNCSFINRQFYAVIQPLIWRTIFIQRNATARQFIHCVKNTHHPVGQHVRSINLGNLAWTNTDLFDLMPHVSGLEELCINSAENISDTSFQHLPRHCPRLQYLRLYNSAITHVSIQELGQHCHQLRELDLMDCSGLSAHTFSALVDCPLEKISIRTSSSCADGGGGGTSWMTATDTAVDLGTKFPRLSYLMIWTSGAAARCFHDFTRRLFQVATWPHLHFLSLDTCSGMDDATLIPFFQIHPRIKDLTLQASDLSDTTLDAIAEHLPGVVHMDLSCSRHLSARGLRQCVQRCLQLQSVYVLDFGNRYGKHLVELDQVAIDAIRLGPGEHAHSDDDGIDLSGILGSTFVLDIDQI